MEENLNGNVNLGNLNNVGAVPPTYGTTEVVNNFAGNQNISFGNTQPVMNVQASVQDNAPVQVEQPVAETVTNNICDKFIVNVELLRALINGAKKVANYNPVQVKSQVVGIEMGPEGLKVVASNEDNDYERVDTTYRYVNTLKVCVNINKLAELLGYMDFETVEFEYTDNKVLKIMLPTGVYPFAQIIDPSTQQPIELGITFPIKYEDMLPINYDTFINAINSSKAIRTSKMVDEELRGLLFASKVVATDYSLMFVQDNQDILKTQKFFISNELCSLITDTNFNSKDFRIAFTSDSNNDIVAITVSDGKTTLCGKVMGNNTIPEDVIENYWNAKADMKLSINTKKFHNALNRISVFQDDDLSDMVYMEISGSNVILKTNNSVGVDGITIPESVSTPIKCQLPFAKLRAILGGIKDSEIYLTEDSSQPNSLYLDAGEYKWVIAKMSV